MPEQYSQIIAPFKRTYGGPLEANRDFTSIEELLAFAKTNQYLLYEGLVLSAKTDVGKLPVPVRETFQASLPDVTSTTVFYVVSKNKYNTTNNMVEPLIGEWYAWCMGTEADCILFKAAVDDNKVTNEDIMEMLKALLGVEDPAMLPEDLNSLSKIASVIASIQTSVTLLNNFKTEQQSVNRAITGASTDDVVSYLKTLRYANMTMLNNKIEEFFDKTNPDDDSIDTWKELSAFLAGFKDTDTLKGKMEEIIGSKITFKDSSTVTVTDLDLKSGREVSMEVLVDPDAENQILKHANGLYFNLSLKDEVNGGIGIYVNGNLKKIIDIAGAVDLNIDDFYYDAASENLIIVISAAGKKKTVRIPLSQALREWETDNSNTQEPIHLHLSSSVGEGKDKLSAELVISTDPSNLLQKTENGLLAPGKANLIAYKNSTVYDALNDLETKISSDKDISKIEGDLEALQQKVTDLDKKHAEDIANLNLEFTNNLNDQYNKLHADDDAIRQELNDKIASQEENITTAIEAVRTEFTEKLEEAKAGYDKKLEEMQASIDSLSKTVSDSLLNMNTNLGEVKEAIRQMVEYHRWLNA